MLLQLRPDSAERIEFRSCDIDEPDKISIIKLVGPANIPALACFLRGTHHEAMTGVRP